MVLLWTLHLYYALASAVIVLLLFVFHFSLYLSVACQEDMVLIFLVVKFSLFNEIYLSKVGLLSPFPYFKCLYKSSKIYKVWNGQMLNSRYQHSWASYLKMGLLSKPCHANLASERFLFVVYCTNVLVEKPFGGRAVLALVTVVRSFLL